MYYLFVYAQIEAQFTTARRLWLNIPTSTQKLNRMTDSAAKKLPIRECVNLWGGSGYVILKIFHFQRPVPIRRSTQTAREMMATRGRRGTIYR